MGRQEACDALSVSDDALASAVRDINSIDRIITLDSGSVSLSRQPDLLDPQAIFRAVHGRGRVEVLDVADSTNTIMLASAANEVSGDVLMAEIQTAGRGRRGNRWNAGIGRGLALSMAWRFPAGADVSPLAVAAGVAVANSLDGIRKGIMVKWPNDLVLDGGKLAGILIETEKSGGETVAVIGIGLNVYKGSEQGAFLAEKPELGLRNRVSATVIDALRECCRTYASDGLAPFADEIGKRDFLKGRKVEVEDGRRHVSGKSSGIDESGCLVLESSGKTEALRSGHVLSF
jgi:BirA family biotin operon repressor/biotin-[acetyl-CoA-carboxylase] ligase